ncbi:MAG TPA: FecR domain-containing protein [Polyangiales bacterium]|nr:FecR domain-containing protein [Polyangiales bacterium]
MDLDDQAGARLRALALGERERSALGDEAQARIAARVAQQGPGLVRRARQTRRALQLSAGLCALAMAWGASRLFAPAPTVAHRVDPRPAPAMQPAASAMARRACELRAGTEPAAAAGVQDDAQRIELGAMGVLLAEAGSALWVDADDPCRTRVRLQSGAVLVHAVDLGGGELRVATDRGDVVVHGTLFRVARPQGELTVEVAEGKVSVVQHGRVLVPAIAAGQRARLIDGQAPVLESLTAVDRAALIDRLAPPSAAGELAAQTAADAADQAPPASAAGAAHGEDAAQRSARLVQEADGLWRDGRLELARARYREAGSLSGPTAEAAWLALARRELSAGRDEGAQRALQAYAARFPRGALVAEAAGIAFRAALERGDVAAARQQAELLVRRHPQTAQAEAAARWLASRPRP